MLAFASLGIPRLFRSRTSSRFNSVSRCMTKKASPPIFACAENRIEEVKRIANLAQLEFSDEELHEIAPEFEKIVGFFNEMNELDVSDVEPMSRPNELRNVMRDDTPVRFNNVDSMMNEAPQVERDYVRVPKISSESTE